MVSTLQKIAVLSDAHIGAVISNFSTYRAQVYNDIKDYDHVVFNGDMFELFYVKTRPLMSDKRALRDQYERSMVELEELIQENPNRKIHLVLGNHELINKFQNGLDKLQAKHQNFQWDPEAIRIGDAFFTHGHLPMSGKPHAETKTYRLREAEEHRRTSTLWEIMERPGQAVVDWMRRPSVAVHRTWKSLNKWVENENFSYKDNRENYTLDSLDWIKHVFFGHTHVKFDNYQRFGWLNKIGLGGLADLWNDGISYHNSGAFTKVKSGQIGDLGMLHAELSTDGKVTGVRRFYNRHENEFLQEVVDSTILVPHSSSWPMLTELKKENATLNGSKVEPNTMLANVRLENQKMGKEK